MEADDKPYKAICKRHYIFARHIKDFDDTEDEEKTQSPFQK